jgi:hypothetical protein
MKLHVLVYRETVWYVDSKEHLVQVCLIHYLKCYSFSLLYVFYGLHNDALSSLEWLDCSE